MSDLRLRLLEAARRRAGTIEDMDLEQIRAARTSRLPRIPGLDPVVRRLATAVFGTPRAEVDLSWTKVDGAEGPLNVRVYRPARASAELPLLVYFHGGGWTTGGPIQYDWLCTTLAADAGVVVASVDYRKAPEHPAPAAAEDAVAAASALAKDPTLVGANGPVGVAGDSAGGNLSALACIGLRDAGGPELAAQLLCYPATDLTRSFPSVQQLVDEPILPRSSIDAFLGHYLSGGADPADPQLSPWFVEDLSDLPPALTQTAERDPLRDEGRAYAERLADAGVESRWTEYADAPHGFLSIPGVVPVARQAVHEMAMFLRRHLHGETTGPRP